MHQLFTWVRTGTYVEEKSVCWSHNVVCRTKSPKLSFKGFLLGWLMVGWAAPWDQLQGMVKLGGEHVCCPGFVLGRGGHKVRVPVWG